MVRNNLLNLVINDFTQKGTKPNICINNDSHKVYLRFDNDRLASLTSERISWVVMSDSSGTALERVLHFCPATSALSLSEIVNFSLSESWANKL